jgi:hypothetical protein
MSVGHNLSQEGVLKAVADVGSTRVVGEVVKVNPLTTLIKIEPMSLIKVLRRYFMYNGISMESYKEMLKGYGITRDGIIKRHNLKHRVSLC